MNITKSQLKRIIKEELESVLREQEQVDPFFADMVKRYKKRKIPWYISKDGKTLFAAEDPRDPESWSAVARKPEDS